MINYIIFAIILPCLVFCYEHDFAICTIFKNEARWLPEFIEHHAQLGCTRFYLYNNNSEDNPEIVLEPYISSGLVELILWTPPIAPYWGAYQMAPYNDCLERIKGKVKWLAVIDADEFIMPVNGKQSLDSLLSKADDNPSIAAFYIHWQCFGTSGLWDIPEMGLRSSLIRRKDYSKVGGWLMKYICRVDYTKKPEIHGCVLKPTYINYNCCPFNEIRINHYQFRGKKNAIERRYYGYNLRNQEVTPAELLNPDIANWIKNIDEYEEIEDTTAWQYVSQ